MLAGSDTRPAAVGRRAVAGDGKVVEPSGFISEPHSPYSSVRRTQTAYCSKRRCGALRSASQLVDAAETAARKALQGRSSLQAFAA